MCFCCLLFICPFCPFCSPFETTVTTDYYLSELTGGQTSISIVQAEETFRDFVTTSVSELCGGSNSSCWKNKVREQLAECTVAL